MTPKSEFGSRVKFFFWKISLEMIEFILIRNPNEILRVKLSKLGFHFQNFIPYKQQPKSHYLQNPKFSVFRSIIRDQISRIFDPLFTEPDFFTEKCKKSTLPKGSFVKKCKKLGSIIEGLKILTAVKKSRKKKLNVDFWSKK